MHSLKSNSIDAALPTAASATALRLMPFECVVPRTSEVKSISNFHLTGPGDTFLIHRLEVNHNQQKVAPSEAALFGLIPSWACDPRSATQNCVVHVSSISNKPAFRSALQQAQFCWLSVTYFLGSVWKNGRQHPVRIQRADSKPLHLAGIWSEWVFDNGTPVLSFCLLTRNMDTQLHAQGVRLGQGLPHCYAAFNPFDFVEGLHQPVEQLLLKLGEIKLPALHVTPHLITDQSRYVT